MIHLHSDGGLQQNFSYTREIKFHTLKDASIFRESASVFLDNYICSEKSPSAEKKLAFLRRKRPYFIRKHIPRQGNRYFKWRKGFSEKENEYYFCAAEPS
jgi:hypothetical protein